MANLIMKQVTASFIDISSQTIRYPDNGELLL